MNRSFLIEDLVESTVEPTPHQQQQLLSLLLAHLSQSQQHSLTHDSFECSSAERDPFYSTRPSCFPDRLTLTTATSSSGATDYDAPSHLNAQVSADCSLSNVSADEPDADGLHGPLSTPSLDELHEEEMGDDEEEDDDGQSPRGSGAGEQAVGTSGGGAGASKGAGAVLVSRKSRRRRTAFSAAQLQSLERQFGHHKYLSVADRAEIAQRLRLSETQIKTWYQNRRYVFSEYLKYIRTP